jgi:hypothetical protein
MKENKRDQDKESLLALAQQLNIHCDKGRSVVNGFETAQINNKQFSLSKTFYTTTSPSLTKALNGLLKRYETLRLKVREVAQIGYVSFENSFPELNINFETYYSVASSLLNLTFQMQLMRLYCYRLLKS